MCQLDQMLCECWWHSPALAAPRTPFHQELCKKVWTRACKQRCVCTSTRCEGTCVGRNNFPLAVQRRKAVACFPDISTTKLHCVGFADGHVCASSSFALLAGGMWPMPPSSSNNMGEAGKWEELESGTRCWKTEMLLKSDVTVLDAHRPCLWEIHRSS